MEKCDICKIVLPPHGGILRIDKGEATLMCEQCAEKTGSRVHSTAPQTTKEIEQ